MPEYQGGLHQEGDVQTLKEREQAIYKWEKRIIEENCKCGSSHVVHLACLKNSKKASVVGTTNKGESNR